MHSKLTLLTLEACSTSLAVSTRAKQRHSTALSSLGRIFQQARPNLLPSPTVRGFSSRRFGKTAKGAAGPAGKERKEEKSLSAHGLLVEGGRKCAEETSSRDVSLLPPVPAPRTNHGGGNNHPRNPPPPHPALSPRPIHAPAGRRPDPLASPLLSH